MHLNDEQIQRWLHGELDATQQAALSRHVADCRQCSQQVEEAKREEETIFDLLSHVDHPAPVVDVEALVGRRGGTSAVWGKRVAGIVLAVALAGAAYAIPGSPLPELLNQVAGWITGRTPSPPGDESPAPPVTSGISVPVGERFTIRFVVEQDKGTVTVSLTDGPNVAVRAQGGTATFTTDVDRLTIDNQESAADYEIEVPRDAPWVEVFVGSRQLVLKDGDRFVTDAPADAEGRYVLPLTPSGPSGE